MLLPLSIEAHAVRLRAAPPAQVTQNVLAVFVPSCALMPVLVHGGPLGWEGAAAADAHATLLRGAAEGLSVLWQHIKAHEVGVFVADEGTFHEEVVLFKH